MRSSEGLILEVLALIEDEKNARGNAVGAWNHDDLAARLVEAVLQGYEKRSSDRDSMTVEKTGQTFVDGSPVSQRYLDRVATAVNNAVDDDPGEIGEILSQIGMVVLEADTAEDIETWPTFQSLFPNAEIVDADEEESE